MPRTWLLPVLSLALAVVVRADGPADNQVAKVRPVPPPGISLRADDRQTLQAGVDELGKQITLLRDALKVKAGPIWSVAGCADLRKGSPLGACP